MNRKHASGEPGWRTGSQLDSCRHLDNEGGGEAARARFAAIHATLSKAMGSRAAPLDVADIGCGAGAQCRLWAERGHRAYGIDINKALIALARKRAGEMGLEIGFDVAAATALPWPDQSMDLCLVPELLQHVPDWRACLAEAVRVLRPGGALYISTSNVMCPVQEEFKLPLYSWYPGFLKRHYEDLAATSRPELAGYAAHPAVNWFTFYGLRRHLACHGLSAIDRFEMSDPAGQSLLRRAALALVRASPLLRFCAHVATPYTIVLAFKPGP